MLPIRRRHHACVVECDDGDGLDSLEAGRGPPMERWSNRVFRDGTPRSLRETPLLLLAGVAIFVIWAIVLAGVLLRDDEPDSVVGLAADQPTATATASPTPSETAAIATGTIHAATIPPATATNTVTQLPSTTDTTTSATTVAQEPSSPTEPQPTTQATRISNPALEELLDLLPALDDVPDGFVVTNEGSLALDELAALHPDPEMQRERLRVWGFTGAAERQFEAQPGSDGTPDGLTLLAAFIVEFRTADGARAAVEASHADAQAAENTDVSDARIEPLGDFTRAASGTLTIDGETLRIAYVIIQIGNRAISFAGGSPTEDPLPAVIEVAKSTLNSL